MYNSTIMVVFILDHLEKKQISSDPLLASYVEFVIMLGFRQRNLDVTITTETTSAEQVNKEK